jgi:hypothetical protein
MADNDYINFDINGGCYGKEGSYVKTSHGKCVTLFQGTSCSKNHFECSSDSGCGLGHHALCQSKQPGFCNTLDTLPDESYLHDETESWNKKVCTYDKSVCDSISNYKLAVNFSADQVAGSISGTDMDKCTSHFCSLPATGTCGIDPATGNPFESCSRFNALGYEGTNCKKWLNNQTDADRDSAISNVCINNPDLGDCACERRIADKTYRTVVDGFLNPINDGCWWGTCKSPGVYLTTSELIDPTCPTDICQQIIDVDRTGGDVTISDLNTNIQCNLADDVVADDVVADDVVVKKQKMSKILVSTIILVAVLLFLILFLKWLRN